jgi:uncharacterized protein YbaR (Trm112 family)
MIDQYLLEILACPVCKTRLSLSGIDRLTCPSCQRGYPIRDGIPILLEEQAITDTA